MEIFGKVIRSAAAIAVLSTAVFAESNITGTKHNLSYTGPSATVRAAAGENNDEICVYCHTPHAGNVAFVGAPLWNKKSPVSTGFTMYGAASSGVAGVTLATTATDAVPNNPSLACLSCHDGVSAINSIVNTPGSGVNADTTNYLTTFMGAATAKVMPAAGVTNIGVDLRNDHPVSIVYTAGRASLRATNSNLTTVTGLTWSGATTVLNLLRGAGSDRVECGSCHDPHEATNATFLRVANAGSKLCIGCHAK